MKIILPTELYPINDGLYVVKFNKQRTGFCYAKNGKRSAVQSTEGMAGLFNFIRYLPNTGYFKDVQFIAETTAWFSTDEFVPQVPGVYEIKVPALDGDDPWYAKWDGEFWFAFCTPRYDGVSQGKHAIERAGAKTAQQPGQNGVYKVLHFRGINIQTA